MSLGSTKIIPKGYRLWAMGKGVERSSWSFFAYCLEPIAYSQLFVKGITLGPF